MTMHLIDKTILAALCWASAVAASPVMPTDAQVASAAQGAATRTQAAIEKAEHQARSQPPVMPVINLTPTDGQIPDPETLAKRFNEAQQAKTSALFVFASFSMPKESLDRLSRQTRAANGVIVIRGMTGNSMSATVQQAAEYVKKYPGIQFQIDPTLFKRFSITTVPTILVALDADKTKACQKQCENSDNHVMVSGDVSLDYALEYMEARAGTAFAAPLRQYIAKVRTP